MKINFLMTLFAGTAPESRHFLVARGTPIALPPTFFVFLFECSLALTIVALVRVCWFFEVPSPSQ